MNKSEHEVVWHGNSWDLRVETRRLADGSTSEAAYINHPGAVVILPWQDNGSGSEILMLQQYRHSLRDTILEVPAGTRGWDEDWLVCAQRELREETGFRAQEFIDLGRCWPAPGVSNEVLSIYLARGLSYDPLPKDADEDIEVIPYRLDKLITMALNGRLLDAKSTVGIIRAAYYLKTPPFNG